MKKAKKKSSKKKISAFWIFYIALVACLFVCSVLAINYLKKCITEYENALPDRYMDYLTSTTEGNESLKEFIKSKADSLLKNDRFEDKSLYEKELSDMIGNASVSYEANKLIKDANNPGYILTFNNGKSLNFGIKAKNQVTKLKLLVISDWDMDYVEIPRDYIDYNIIAPSTYKITINGNELNESDVINSENFEALEAAAELIEVPKFLTYEVKELGFKPEVKMFNLDGDEVPCSWIDDTTVKSDIDFFGLETISLNELPIDVLTIAKNWSRFYMNELPGPYGGMNTVRQYLVPDSFLDERAYEYGSRGFYEAVTGHSLSSIVNESVTNYTEYNEKCFSVDVYFLKNLLVTNGRLTTDEFYNRLFFVYVTDNDKVSDGWYLADVRTVLE